MTPSATSYNQRSIVAGAALTSLLGLLFHNWWDLPELTLLSPENSGPTLITVILFAAWWHRTHARLTILLLLLWSLIQLVGGGVVSVIPFTFLPFYPEQSMHHYLGHVVYIVTQIPLMILMIQQLRNVE